MRTLALGGVVLAMAGAVVVHGPPPAPGYGGPGRPSVTNPGNPVTLPRERGGQTGRVPGGLTGTGSGLTGDRGVMTRTQDRAERAEDAQTWERWWRLNSDEYLRLELAATDAVTQPADHDSLAFLVSGRALPALLQGLRHENAEFASTCLLTLARIVPDEHRSTALANVDRLLPRTTGAVQAAAILALGEIGDGRARATLESIVADQDEGRRKVDVGEEIPCYLRSLAALSLGLLHEPASAEVLCDAVAHADCDQFRTCLLLGAAAAAPQDPRVIRAALSVAEDGRQSAALRGQAVIALAHTETSLGRSVLGSLVRLLEERSSPRELRAALCQALGGLATLEDAEALRALRRSSGDGDVAVRSTAWLSLGRLLERDSPAAATAASRESTLDFLLHAVRRPDHTEDRGFAALAAGLAVRATPADSRERQQVAEKLEETLDDERSPSATGALLIGLGLAGHAESALAVVDRLERTPRELVGRSAAEALTLLASRQVAERMENVLRSASTADDVKAECVRALVKVGRLSALGGPASTLARSGSLWTKSFLARSLGTSRQPVAAEPLLDLLTDTHATTADRSLAASALGELAEPGAAWFAPYSRDASWIAQEPTLAYVQPE